MTRPTNRPRQTDTRRARLPASGVTLLDAMGDPALFGRLFDGPSWRPWRSCAAALFGLTGDLPEAGADLARRCLGRSRLPSEAAHEAWLIIGRRGGKSRFAALVAVYLACFRDYRARLAPGERGVFMVIAADRLQARVVHQYIKGLLHSVPMLDALVAKETSDAIELTSRITIAIHTASHRTIRGYTVVGAICDEVAFWPTEGAATPDREILQALRPAMATVPGAVLLCISSPYARRGELWQAYRMHFGQEDAAVLVWQADTCMMNPTVSDAFIARAYEDDPAAAAAEYGAEFRRDIEAFVSPEAIDAVTVPGRHELPPVEGTSYVGFLDPSGGSQDAMTLAIAHQADDRAVLDAVREVRPPFSPEAVVAEFAAVLRTYGITRVRGDRYAGEWPREQVRKARIEYEVCETPKSDLYKELLPALNSGCIELLDHARLRAQLAGLERRTARGGRDSIDHAPGGHDDVVNAAAGSLIAAASCGFTLTDEWVESFAESVRAGRRKSPWFVGERWP